jgi:hypothetical protein
MTPITPRILFSVSIDVFYLAPTEWAGQEYDCILLCVDRLSGWMIAKPALKLGLTAEKAAHLMMDDGWNIFGVPSIVTSDQGPHFVGAWWKTMCRRLGIRQVFSQAHRPQANGRAEVAGRVLIAALRKLEAERAINWVESLPHSLRLIHDTSGPSGYSPYQIVFGRDRNMGGIPYEGSECAEEAGAFMDRMRILDREVASILDTLHALERDRVNKNRRDSHPFRVGQLVMLTLPKSVGGNKLKAGWRGPYYLRERKGESSFVLEYAPQHLLEVHVDQLKPYLDDLSPDEGIPMSYRARDPPTSSPLEAERILDHRPGPEGPEFLVRWKGAPASCDSWEASHRFIDIRSMVWRQYCHDHGVNIRVD